VASGLKASQLGYIYGSSNIKGYLSDLAARFFKVVHDRDQPPQKMYLAVTRFVVWGDRTCPRGYHVATEEAHPRRRWFTGLHERTGCLPTR
jgi:hypothetical protein